MGYKLAGCEVLGCCEIDPRMNRVYLQNHKPKHNFLMDIRKFNELPNDEIPPELFDLDILDGSPPCTTFSTAGLRERTWGKEKKFREGQVAQTLDDLSFIFIETVNKLRPKTVVMENVAGLLQGEAWGYVQKIYKDFAAIGYNLKHWLLKGESMGVPQARHRVIFVAVRKDIDFDLESVSMEFNYEPITYKEVKEGIGKELIDGTDKKAILMRSLPCDKRLMEVLMRETGDNSKYYTEYILQDDNVPPTLTANSKYYRGNEKTWITNEDARNISTFPRDYDFLDQNVQYICGMSVPPLMIKRVVSRLIESGLYDYKLN